MLEMLQDLPAHKGYANGAMRSERVRELEMDWARRATDAELARLLENDQIPHGRFRCHRR